MLLDSCVVRAGETAGPEADGFHAEVTPVLLYEQIGAEFRNSEKGMQRLIDGHQLIDAMPAYPLSMFRSWDLDL